MQRVIWRTERAQLRPSLARRAHRRPGPGPRAPRSVPAEFTSLVGRLPAPAAPCCLTTMDLLLLCILVLFCINKVNTPFKLNASPGDWMGDLARSFHLAWRNPGSRSDFNPELSLESPSLLFKIGFLPVAQVGFRTGPGAARPPPEQLKGPPWSAGQSVSQESDRRPCGPCQGCLQNRDLQRGQHREKGSLCFHSSVVLI